MKIVVDTNIFISAYIYGGDVRGITTRYAKKSDALFITDEIMNEVKNVFGRPKFGLSKEQFDYVITDIEKHGNKVTVLPQHQIGAVCRDPKDIKYLECAVAAKADCIITGDLDLLVLKEYNGIKILTAKEYLDIVNCA